MIELLIKIIYFEINFKLGGNMYEENNYFDFSNAYDFNIVCLLK